MSICEITDVHSEAYDRTIVLHGIPWDQYEQITDVLGEYHLRHVYVEGKLEMRSVLHGVSWADYCALLAALGNRNLRHTFDRGTLEMMSPLKEHDWIKSLIARLVETMCYELEIDIQTIGSTTLTSEQEAKGLQPDEAYYVQHEPEVRGKSHYDADSDPPPDIAIEVDVTNKVLPRLPVFSGLNIKELWRFDSDRLHILVRSGGGKKARYREVARSKAFPFLRATDLTQALALKSQMPENAVIREFVLRAKELRENYRPQRSKRKRKKD